MSVEEKAFWVKAITVVMIVALTIMYLRGR